MSGTLELAMHTLVENRLDLENDFRQPEDFLDWLGIS
jgi:hypothetical protein